MQAQLNHTYAHILNGLVHWIFTSVELPEWDETTFQTVDITALSPMPTIGMKYDSTTGAFSDPMTLQDYKDVQKYIIATAYRDYLAKGQLISQGYTMQTTWEDGVKIKASYDLAITLGQATTAAASVRDITNVTHACTVADLLSISAQIGSYALAALEKKWGYEDQIKNAATPADVQAIVWQ